MTRGNRPIQGGRADEDVHDRIERAAARAGVAKAVWVTEAVMMALEDDEAHADRPHVPKAVAEAMPRRANGMILLPQGRVFDRR